MVEKKRGISYCISLCLRPVSVVSIQDIIYATFKDKNRFSCYILEGKSTCFRWRLSRTVISASCQVDSVPLTYPAFTFLPFSILFIPLLFIPLLLDFSLSAPVGAFSVATFLSTSIFTCLGDMTAGPVN